MGLVFCLLGYGQMDRDIVMRVSFKIYRLVLTIGLKGHGRSGGGSIFYVVRQVAALHEI